MKPYSIGAAPGQATATVTLAIRELADAYAHCADRRDAKGQMALSAEDTAFLVYMDAKADTPAQELHGRDALAPIFENLNIYAATTHFNGQSTVEFTGERATGESYFIAQSRHDRARRLEKPDDRLDPLSRRVREAGWRLVLR